MTPLHIVKGRHSLFLDRNRDEGFIRMADMAMFLSADDLARLGAYATALARTLKREEAYSVARIEASGRDRETGLDPEGTKAGSAPL